MENTRTEMAEGPGVRSGGFGGPGYWECDYARAQDVLAIAEATTVLDCAAGTMTTNATFVVDNQGGADEIELHMSGLHGTRAVLGDVELQCTGLCSDGDPCPDGEPIAVAAGATGELVHQFGPASCLAPEGDVDLCSFCGATGELQTYWGLTGSGTGDSGTMEFEVTITCL